MTRYLPAILAGLILALSGAVHGLRTDRWWVSQARTHFIERVPTIPTRVGDWVGEDLPLNERHVRVAQADAALSRRFRRSRTGKPSDEVLLILLSGRAAPMAVHTPDFCFTNVGYKLDGEPKTFTPEIDGKRQHSFWRARFTHDADPHPWRVYWAWNDGKRWQASDDPRGEFGRARALCKMYLVCSEPTAKAIDDSDSAQELITEILPELTRILALP